MIDPDLPDDPDSKVNICVGKVFEIWEQTKAQRSAQLVFCDLSTPKAGVFNVYDDMKAKLIERGIPEAEIAYIHEANTDARKTELFGKVRSGAVRVLMGSTAKMGAGTNVQKRLIALHHLDVPWRPSDIEQREGRILRQGNENKEVYVFRYVTEGTFDAYSWQLIENKQKFIGQIMTSKSPARSCDDMDEAALSYAEVKALAAGNPLIKEKMDLDIQLTRLKTLKAAHDSQIYDLENKIAVGFPQEIQRCKELVVNLTADERQRHCDRYRAGTTVSSSQSTAWTGGTIISMMISRKSNRIRDHPEMKGAVFMKKSIAMLGMVLMLAGCAAAESEPLAAEPAALVEISPATEETAQTVEAAETTNPAQTATPAPTQDPIPMPTAEPTPAPTAAPTAAPTQAPVEESVADTPAQVNMSYGAVPFDLAAGTEQWWSIDSSDSAYWAVQENINAIRAAVGLSPLAMDGGLSAAADARCESFVAGGAFDHSGMTTRSEICAAGPIGSASSVCSYWQNSPAHYANIVNSSFTSMGVGCWFCQTAEGQYTYWTVTFN